MTTAQLHTGSKLNIGSAFVDASGLTAARTQALPDKAGTFAMLADIPSPAVGVSSQSSAYTFVLGDANSVVQCTAGTSNTFTVPPNSSVAFPVGTTIYAVPTGLGVLTIAAGSGVTLNSAGDSVKSRLRYSLLGLVKLATDKWLLYGDLL